MRSKWAARRAADRPPSKGKTARYDRENSIAAAAILAEPDRHPKFMQEWAKRFMQRQARERMK